MIYTYFGEKRYENKIQVLSEELSIKTILVISNMGRESNQRECYKNKIEGTFGLQTILS